MTKKKKFRRLPAADSRYLADMATIQNDLDRAKASALLSSLRSAGDNEVISDRKSRAYEKAVAAARRKADHARQLTTATWQQAYEDLGMPLPSLPGRASGRHKAEGP